jgi:hypothetical protein
MITSQLISKKQEIERELRWGVQDSKRKRHLLARLGELQRDIGRMGFSDEDVAKNDFAYSPNVQTVESQQHYVPLPTHWDGAEKERQKTVGADDDGKPGFERLREAREAVYARHAATMNGQQPHMRHGTVAMYQTGCRCDACVWQHVHKTDQKK